MLSIGIVYPNFRKLVEFENLIELKPNSKNLYSTLEFINANNPKLCLEIFKESDNHTENDFAIILTDTKGKNKAYFINEIEVISYNENSIIVNAFLLKQTNEVFKVWKEYFENGVTEFHQWKKIKNSEKKSWLEPALSFQDIDYDNQKSIIEIDGKYIKSIEDFLCIIGEALNGKGGYFGRDLYGFYDCLQDPEFGTANLKTLIWHNHKKCRWRLKKNFFKIINLLKEFNIDTQLK